MSIVWSLKRLFDPAAHAYEEGERKSERELPRDTQAGNPPRFEVTGRPPRAAPPARFCCRVCSYESKSDEYCPACLADTMEPAREVRSP
jgi:rubrerythrin